ncbi:uncharacterized protein A4U43_C04F7670 [Asparagus officinalis]|uniref:E3 ubiquitin-protein ligase RMA n=1 Tax=Asparagus officinalis TaxID=4686 RepID=A0A5P1F1R9_ASPOF|nr:E3 ubiquitin-protein ligase RMA3-like [Asparagus officinalis]ONK71357.1 uncharacterized protein A4U43_C04F7670 [Asparagus officinalis]
MEVEGIPNGYFTEAIEEPHIEQEPKKKGETPPPQPSVSSASFDCNICLDFAVDPVVTLCGHLYCWPCIYKWLEMDNTTDSTQHCPVCKASLSQDSLVPLYGRGHSTKNSSHQTFTNIPQRPNSSVHHQRSQSEISDEEENPNPNHRHRHHHHYHVHQHEHHHHYPSLTNRVIHSTAGGVLGGMAIAVLPWVFRNHQESAASMQFANSSSPYYVGGSGGSLRRRRQEMEVETSLHQIWVFLFCCAMLCLLLF